MSDPLFTVLLTLEELQFVIERHQVDLASSYGDESDAIQARLQHLLRVQRVLRSGEAL